MAYKITYLSSADPETVDADDYSEVGDMTVFTKIESGAGYVGTDKVLSIRTNTIKRIDRT